MRPSRSGGAAASLARVVCADSPCEGRAEVGRHQSAGGPGGRASSRRSSAARAVGILRSNAALRPCLDVAERRDRVVHGHLGEDLAGHVRRERLHHPAAHARSRDAQRARGVTRLDRFEHRRTSVGWQAGDQLGEVRRRQASQRGGGHVERQGVASGRRSGGRRPSRWSWRQSRRGSRGARGAGAGPSSRCRPRRSRSARASARSQTSETRRTRFAGDVDDLRVEDVAAGQRRAVLVVRRPRAHPHSGAGRPHPTRRRPSRPFAAAVAGGEHDVRHGRVRLAGPEREVDDPPEPGAVRRQYAPTADA